MTKSIHKWANDAVDHVQSACNLSGIVFAFANCIDDLTAEAKRLGEGGEWIDRHPIGVLWADKMDDLSRSRKFMELSCSRHLSVVVPEFALLMQRVCDDAHENSHGTDWKNEHPEVQKFVRKIVAITDSRNTTRLFDAFEECERIADHKVTGETK